MTAGDYEGAHRIVATRQLRLTPPGAEPVDVTVNVREPREIAHRWGNSWLCDYELLVGSEARELKGHSDMGSLAVLHGAILRAADSLPDLRAEGALSWPDGGDDVGLPGRVKAPEEESLPARMFVLGEDSYSGQSPIVGSYKGTRTPTGGAPIDVRVDVSEPRGVEGRGWLADWELTVGAETTVQAAAWGVDSLAAVHAAMVGASAAVDDVEGEPEDSWITFAGGAGLYGLLRHAIHNHGPNRTAELGLVVAERVLELHRDGEATPSGFAIARVGLPKPEQPTGGRWACSYEIAGLGEAFGGRVLGDDSGQALMVCLATVGDVLESRAGLQGRSIRWQGNERLGFPPMPQRRIKEEPTTPPPGPTLS